MNRLISLVLIGVVLSVLLLGCGSCANPNPSQVR